VRAMNLASQPFRNEALPWIVWGSACAGLLVITVVHLFFLTRLLSDKTARLDREAVSAEQELFNLRRSAPSPGRPHIDEATLQHWALLSELVDRRTFSWTDLLSRLEEVLPADVRLTSIAPVITHGEISLNLTAIARSHEAGLAFVSRLEGHGDFKDVYPESASQSPEGEQFHYRVGYDPKTHASAGARGDRGTRQNAEGGP
jgi:Tfp pilus assembly protein PilN